MRKIKSEPAVKDAARGAINARSYTGAAQNKLASQCKALLLRLTRTLGITTDNIAAPEAADLVVPSSNTSTGNMNADNG